MLPRMRLQKRLNPSLMKSLQLLARPHAPGIFQWTPALIRRDSGRRNERAPFFDFRPEKRAKLVGGRGRGDISGLFELRFHRGDGVRGMDVGVEFPDDVMGRKGRN